MAFFSDVFTVGTATAVQIVPPSNVPQHVTIHNQQKQANHYIYIGGSAGISTTNAAHLDHSETRQFVIAPGDVMFALGDADDYKIGVTRMIF